MKKIQFLALFVATVSLEANYCIQVLTTNLSEKNVVIDQAKSSKYDNLQNVRVESRSSYLVFRIGDYSRYRDAQNDIKQIKKSNADAYIRKCDLIEENTLYSRNIQKIAYQEEVYFDEAPLVKKNTQQKYIQKNTYPKKQELSTRGTTSVESLWGDCRKCFIPVYEEETAYEEENKINVQRETRSSRTSVRPKKREITIHKEPTQPISFWDEDILEEDTAPTIIEEKRSKNKFDINEQFLP